MAASDYGRGSLSGLIMDGLVHCEHRTEAEQWALSFKVCANSSSYPLKHSTKLACLETTGEHQQHNEDDLDMVPSPGIWNHGVRRDREIACTLNQQCTALDKIPQELLTAWVSKAPLDQWLTDP